MESRRDFGIEAPRGTASQGEGRDSGKRKEPPPPVFFALCSPATYSQAKVPRKGSIQALPRAQDQGGMLLPRK